MRFLSMVLGLTVFTASVVLGQESGIPGARIVGAASARAQRILVYHDMEGLAGRLDARTVYAPHPKYPEARADLLEDVNAVVAGLYDGGAKEVWVVDAHGSLSRTPDLDWSRLDARAKPIVRQTPFDPYLDLPQRGAFDAIVAIGMHARGRGQGFASHTLSLGIAVELNGVPVSESHLLALLWGEVGVPLILVTGDNRLRADLAQLPGLEYVVTKRAVSPARAVIPLAQDVRAALRTGARRALGRFQEARVLRLVGPVRTRIEAYGPASAAQLAMLPGLVDPAGWIAVQAPDMSAAFGQIRAIVSLATRPLITYLVDAVARDSTGLRLMREAMDSVTRVWLDNEATGRREPLRPRPPAAGFFGVQ